MTDDEVEAVARRLHGMFGNRRNAWQNFTACAEDIITRLDAHRSTAHRHCSAGCEKSTGKLVCAKCGADFTECDPDECVL